MISAEISFVSFFESSFHQNFFYRNDLIFGLMMHGYVYNQILITTMPEQTLFSRKSFTCIFLLILFFLVTISCSTKSTSSYLLTTASVPVEGGSVSPATGEHNDGTEVQIQATANSNWVFDGWEGDQTGSQNPVTVTMNSDKNITARFKVREYSLTVTTEGEGSVTETLVQNKITDYIHGTVVELEADAADGWQFSEWQGDLTGTENPNTLTVDASKSVTAVFEQIEYTIFVQAEGPGIASVDPEKEMYRQGEPVIFGAEPNNENEFLGWFGTFEKFDSVYEHQVTGDIDVTAFFSAVQDAFVIETTDIVVDGGLVEIVVINVTNILLNEILLNEIIVKNESGTVVAEFNFSGTQILPARSQTEFRITFNFDTTDEETFKDWEISWMFDYKGKSYEIEQEIGEPASNAKQKPFPLNDIENGNSISVEIK